MYPVPLAATQRGAFRLQGFIYNECSECGSLYVSPRPTREALEEYYRDSKASRYRVEHYDRDTAKARRIHLLRFHANWLGRWMNEMGNPEARGYADLATHLPLIFEEVRSLGLFDSFWSVNPLAALEAECEAHGVEIAREPLSGLGTLTAFEKVENEFSPYELFCGAAEMLADRGMLFFTTRTISGFDLQVLWDKALYIFVPEHLNLLSLEGLTQLVDRSGFELVELSTPGQLDLELAAHADAQDPSVELQRFARRLIEHDDDEAREDFQAFLQKHRLSSHARVAASKKGGK